VCNVSRFVNGAVIGVVSFLVLLSIFWYLAEVRADSTITYVGMENRWGSVDSSTTGIRSHVTFHNPHRSAAELVRLEHELLVNGERVNWEGRNVSVRFQPASDGSLDVDAAFSTAFLGPWLTSHVREGEHTRFEVRGVATFLVMQRPVLVPYGTEAEWQTHLGTSLASSLENCASLADTPCIGSATFAWDSSTGAPVSVVRATLWNTNDSVLLIRNLTALLHLQDVAVARADVIAGPIELAPQAEREIVLTFRYDLPALATWWPSHVGGCELSPMTTTIRFDRERGNETTPETPDSQSAVGTTSPSLIDEPLWSLPGQAFTTQFVCQRT